jgi:signal transduction histidine kinase
MLASELPVVFGAKNQLYQAIYNLIHNAIEAMRNTADRARILEVRTDHRNNAITVEVSDTGPAIDPAQLPEIFEAFVTTKPQGMGLGLAICRTIVERHEGQLSVAPGLSPGHYFSHCSALDSDRFQKAGLAASPAMSVMRPRRK